jgi:hypothetical protein
MGLGSLQAKETEGPVVGVSTIGGVAAGFTSSALLHCMSESRTMKKSIIRMLCMG